METMKKLMAAMLTVCILTITGCGDTKAIKGVEFDTYGLLNEDENKNSEVQYEVIWGNVIWGVILIETIIAPIYFFGFSCFEPVGEKSKIKGALPQQRR